MKSLIMVCFIKYCRNYFEEDAIFIQGAAPESCKTPN